MNTYSLKFKSKYLSVDEFETVELPEFVVLTGKNGVGKTHLLQAILKGNVEAQGIASNKIVYFNYESFRLNNESSFNANQIAHEKEQAWLFFEKQVLAQARSWGNNVDSFVSDGTPFWDLEGKEVSEYRKRVEAYFGSLNQANQHQLGIHNLAKRISTPLHKVSKEEFVQKYISFNVTNKFLPNQLGKIFWDYYIKEYHNTILDFENEKKGMKHSTLDEEMFIKEHGRKPWEVVNEILSKFDSICYTLSTPEGARPFDNFQLRLCHNKKNGLEVEFDSLSSGERVLMALVASVYNASLKGTFPDLLLLDEVDASLHPSMMNSFIDVIQNTFLEHGMKVILVTHSPTTIALAPEKSIYVMNRYGKERVQKSTNAEAVDVLTEGFATIEQGLTLFDEVTKNPLTIVTEGHNSKILEKALELYEVNEVAVLSGVESITGEKQMRTLYEFFARIPHSNCVLFVWDCDVKSTLEAKNQTFPYIIPQNSNNSLVLKGIENAFPEDLFKDHITTITKADGAIRKEFDHSRKKLFAEQVYLNGTKEDYSHFQHLIDEINRILELRNLK